jgi:hypothetical protein
VFDFHVLDFVFKLGKSIFNALLICDISKRLSLGLWLLAFSVKMLDDLGFMHDSICQRDWCGLWQFEDRVVSVVDG